MRALRLLIPIGLWFALPASAGSTPGVEPSPPHAGSWILVRLRAPLADRAPDGTFPLSTGRDGVDRAILATRVERVQALVERPASSPEIAERRRKFGFDRTYRFHVPPGTDPADAVEQFSGLPEVEYAELDPVGTGGGTLFPNDTRFFDQYAYFQFNDVDVDGPEAWFETTGREDVIIAVLDSGAFLAHGDLATKLVPGWDFVNGDADPSDDHGHGTNVSSIAAARSNNSLGVVGACWNCRIMPIKVLDANNSGLYSWWALGMMYAADNGARVINISAGGTAASSTLLSGVRYAWDAGVIDVSITHNDDAGSIRYPGRYAETIAVGGTDDTDARANPFCYSASSGSNWGPQIDVVAPGELILGAALNGSYNYWCGTSQAAPLVAGLVGLMRSIYPSIGREEARHLLRAAAEDQVGLPAEDTPGFDPFHGWGRVNMERTVLATRASTRLRAAGGATTSLEFDASNPVATSWDFVRGDLAALSETATGVSLGTVVCLENDSPDASTAGNEDSAIPDPGEAFFYVARINSAPGAGSYGGSSLNRDRIPTAGGCP